ncbi:MAG: hypothetical protein ACI4TC_05820 [Kiritimatiellia bacterium]
MKKSDCQDVMESVDAIIDKLKGAIGEFSQSGKSGLINEVERLRNQIGEILKKNEED